MSVDPGSLPPLEIAGRAERVGARLDEAGAAALLVTDLTNVSWLTGFGGSAGRVILRAGGGLTLIVDGRYGDIARDALAAHGVAGDVLVGLSGAEILGHVAALARGCPLAFEADHVSVGEFERLAAVLGGAAALVRTSGVVEQERRRKDPGELARLTLAAAIADQALAEVLPSVQHAPTEIAFARALDRAMEDLGADAPSFPTIVATGPNGGKPHHRPGARPIVEGDALIVDFGALVDGYHSDMTRTYLLGDVDPWFAEAYAVVAEAQAEGAAAVSPERSPGEIDAVCRETIAAAGLGELFTHGTGHGVGRQIHEAPWLRRDEPGHLLAGDVVTVEPGVYRGGLGGVRIEDSVIVTPDGCRPITHTPKDPSCLPSPRTTSRPG